LNRAFYNLIFYLVLPVIVLRLLWRALVLPAPAYARRWGERLGFVDKVLASRTEKRWIWVHAASVGESVAISPLVHKLRSDQPNWGIVVTTMTPTGSERVEDLFGDDVCHVYAPYDYPGAVKRFLKAFKPALVILVETELWPNLIHYSKASGANIIVANARLSDKSYRGYQKFAALGKPMLRKIDCIAAQGDSDAERFRRLGVLDERIYITGSIKFDISVPDAQTALGAQMAARIMPPRPVWIAASTREGEDEKILQALKRVKHQIPNVLLVLVPRHPERFASAQKLSEKNAFKVVRRSSDEVVDLETAVFLGDSMGELLAYYSLAQVAFVGGSLVDTGCHNVLEPAAAGLPVITGPSQFNFQTICEQLNECGALIRVANQRELADRIIELLGDSAQSLQMGQAGKQAIEANRGALERIYTRVVSYLPAIN
jgi:3-deoxy-D-manno-octulosonic-acid transferase